MRRVLVVVTALSVAMSGCATSSYAVRPPSAPAGTVHVTRTAPVAVAAPVTTTIPATEFWSGQAGMLVGVALIAAVALGAAAVVRK